MSTQQYNILYLLQFNTNCSMHKFCQQVASLNHCPAFTRSPHSCSEQLVYPHTGKSEKECTYCFVDWQWSMKSPRTDEFAVCEPSAVVSKYTSTVHTYTHCTVLSNANNYTLPHPPEITKEKGLIPCKANMFTRAGRATGKQLSSGTGGVGQSHAQTLHGNSN